MVDFFCRYLYISSSVDSSIIVQKSSVKTFFFFYLPQHKKLRTEQRCNCCEEWVTDVTPRLTAALTVQHVGLHSYVQLYFFSTNFTQLPAMKRPKQQDLFSVYCLPQDCTMKNLQLRYVYWLMLGVCCSSMCWTEVRALTHRLCVSPFLTLKGLTTFIVSQWGDYTYISVGFNTSIKC